MNLQKLFNPNSIAVVGASEKEGKVGNVIAKNLANLGYPGEVYFVNPKYSQVLGKKCHKNLEEISEKVDLAVISIPAEFISEVIRKNADRIKNYVVISSGFSEIGEMGKKREQELMALARENNLNILGPNCLGFIVPRLKLNVSFAGGMPEAGPVSFVTQSGALAVALMDMAEKENMRFSSIVSIGNKMEISESEMLEFLESDKNTKVIGLYLESVKDGEKFMAAARKISQTKPVIVLKAGKNEKAQKAIASHTGALAGSDDIVSAALKKEGLLRAENMEEFFSWIGFFSNLKSISGGKSVVVTNAGGAGVLTSDAFSGKEVQLADLTSEMKAELKKFLPPESSVENPIDVLGDAHEDRYQKTLEIISRDPEVGFIHCVLTPQDQTPVEKITDVIIGFKNKTEKIVTASFIGGKRVEGSVARLKENGICNFNFPELAVSAINSCQKLANFQKSKAKTPEKIINAKRRAKAVEIIQDARSEKRLALYFDEAEKIMDMYSINTAASFPADPEEKNTAVVFPAALKVDSDKILHKTDKKALILDIKNQDELDEAVKKMRLNFPGSRLIVQPMMGRGMEIIIGIKRDPIFGPVAVYGLGGIYAEFLKTVDYLMPPASISQVEESLSRGKLKFLFRETRGQKGYDLSGLARIILGISVMSLEIPEIKEFDINPLIIYNDGKEAVAVDVKVII